MSYSTNTHSPELKVQTSLFSIHHTQPYANTVYPSPLSCIEQVSPLQDQPSNLDWTQALDESYTPSITIPNSDSDCSSLDIHTPDTKLSDLISNKFPPFGYTSLLHSPDENNMFKGLNLCEETDQSCYPSIYLPSCNMDSDLLESTFSDSQSHSFSSLSHQDQMMLLEKIYPEDFQADTSSLGSSGMMHHRILETQNQSILTTRTETIQNAPLANLSREQLIERVLQLEMEKKSRPSNDIINNCLQSNVTCSNQTNKDEDNDQANMHSCQWDTCDAKAPTLDKLMTHICDSHIGSGKATYFCEWRNCLRNKKPFMKRHKMHNHMRTHTGERPFICTITGCNKAFSRPDSLSTHIKTHSDIRPYLCSVPGCEKAYFHSRSLRKHLKSTHMKQSKFSVRNGVPSNVTHRYRIPTAKRRQTNVDLKSSQMTLSYAPDYATSIFHS